MLLNQLISAKAGIHGWNGSAAANLNRTTKTKRRGKGRTDALKDVMGWKNLSNTNGISFTKKMARRLATLWQLLLEACGLVDQQEVARPVEGEKKESIGDWWSEDLRLECEAGTEGRSGE